MNSRNIIYCAIVLTVALLAIALLVLRPFVTDYKSSSDIQRTMAKDGGALNSLSEVPARQKSRNIARRTKDIAPLPPKETPLVEVRTELWARAEAGELNAASRIFQDTLRCQLARRNIDLVQRELRVALPPGMTADELKKQDLALARRQEFAARAEALNSICNGISDEALPQDTAAAMLLAARLGDTTAAACYVGANPIGGQPSKEDSAAYSANAWPLIQAGIEVGDWSMVVLLQQVYGDSNTGRTLLYKLAARDPLKEYQYLRLMSLGAAGDLASSLNDQLAGQIQGSESARALTPDEVASSNAWAQDIFNKYFSRTPVLREFPTICSLPQ